MTKTIVIAERDNIACVLEDKKAVEFFVHKGDVLLNDVFLAKVDNVLPSIDAAFLDVGIGKMGFLHASDIIGSGVLKEKVKLKDNLLVQVVKEPTGHKGPRLTTQISLPGRFLVLMPYESGINVSKKIESSKERARLKSIVSLMKPVGVGIIIRTEAENQIESDIQDDLDSLLEKWNNIISLAQTNDSPSLIYRDQDLLYKVIREACSDDVSEIIVDTSFAYNRANQLLQTWNLDKNITLTAYKGDEPLLVNKGIDKEIKNALQTKVHLKSGGYLFIQSTEALTVIDVNSGKFISSSCQDETIFKTNIESIYEIARQLKLRNIGGIIIIDFIDMTRREDKIKLLEQLELCLEDDKAKPQIGQLSDFGLVELTRHRQGQSLLEMFTQKCSACNGLGHILSEMKFSSPSSNDNSYHNKFSKVKFPKNTSKNNKKQIQNNKNVRTDIEIIDNSLNLQTNNENIIPIQSSSGLNDAVENTIDKTSCNVLENEPLKKTKKTRRKKTSEKNILIENNNVLQEPLKLVENIEENEVDKNIHTSKKIENKTSKSGRKTSSGKKSRSSCEKDKTITSDNILVSEVNE